MNIVEYNKAFESLVDCGSELSVVSTGYVFIEGPIWNKMENHLTFNDIPVSKTYRYHDDGTVTLIRENTNKGNGNAYDNYGHILTCEHAKSRIVQTNADGSDYKVIADQVDGIELNSPNDIIVDSKNRIYWSDPNFGRRPTRVGVERKQLLPFQSVMMLDIASGIKTPRVLAKNFNQPNGLCLSVDEKKLYVADTPEHKIYVFDVDESGALHNQQLFTETEQGLGPGGPDGIKIDKEGNVYCAASGGIHVFDVNGKPMGVILVPEQAGNFCFGGKDGRSLFITASTTLYVAATKISGCGF